jgi:DNA polymerase III subunit epsilon
LYAIIDIETTGGNALTDKITEIAIYIHNGEHVIDQYATLINPGRTIPSFVQNLTGITDQMVSEAPLFSDVAEHIKKFTDEYIFVAHSSQFDYSFIRQEFKSVGYDFRRPTICTVTFSKQVMPGHRSYGLSSLCERLNIINDSRHRATGDAFATVKLFECLLAKGGREVIDSVIKPHVDQIALPECIKPEIMAGLPSRPGIFYLLNRHNEIIYVGKGPNIRKGVLQMVTKTRHKKSFPLREELTDIRFEETGCELMASILEYYEWKKLSPRYNRKHPKPYHRVKHYNGNGYLVLRGRRTDEETFIQINEGSVCGFTYVDQSSQCTPAELMISLPMDHYVDFIVQRTILKKHYNRLIPL